ASSTGRAGLATSLRKATTSSPYADNEEYTPPSAIVVVSPVAGFTASIAPEECRSPVTSSEPDSVQTYWLTVRSPTSAVTGSRPPTGWISRKEYVVSLGVATVERVTARWVPSRENFGAPYWVCSSAGRKVRRRPVPVSISAIEVRVSPPRTRSVQVVA